MRVNRRTGAVATTVAVPVLALGLAGSAAVADWQAFPADLALLVLDLLVGLAFVGAAATVKPGALRLVVAAVGLSWLAGSVVAATQSVHQAVLAAALLAFPTGRVHGIGRLLVLGAGVVAGSGLLTQPAVALVFVGVAACAFANRPRGGAAVWFPCAAATGVAAVLAVSWWVSRRWPEAVGPSTLLMAYEAVLLAVAVAFPLATRAVGRGRAALADRLVSDSRLVGVEGMATVLGEALGDPRLRVFRWHVDDYVDAAGRAIALHDGPGRLAVEGPAGPVALVVSRSAALEDPPTAAAVSSAVRLALTNLRLLEELQARVGELQASRARLVAATDRQRERAVATLRAEVDEPLRAARTEVARIENRDADLVTTLEIVEGELASAAREIADLVAGVPPVALGEGRLRPALEAVARTNPVPVEVAVAPGAIGDRVAETGLFYAVSEALANVVKHAGASRVTVAVRRDGGSLVATVTDDGVGGADPDGSGLVGLADRLAAHGGRLRVDSPPGAGTTVTATVPSRSSSTAP